MVIVAMIIVEAVDMWKSPWITRAAGIAGRDNLWVLPRDLSTPAQFAGDAPLFGADARDQLLDGVREGGILLDLLRDLFAGVNDRGVIAAAELLADLGQ